MGPVLPEARLHIFKGPRPVRELRRAPRVEWTAARDTEAGEVAFFYHAAPASAIVAVGRAREGARPDRRWGRLAWFDRRMLPRPVSLRELRADPVAGRWAVWKMLSRTTVRLPPMTAAAIARLVDASRPPAPVAEWLGPLLAAIT